MNTKTSFKESVFLYNVYLYMTQMEFAHSCIFQFIKQIEKGVSGKCLKCFLFATDYCTTK